MRLFVFINLLFLINFAVLSGVAEAAPIDSIEITGTGGAPIPATYSTSNAKSLVLTGLVNKVEVCCFDDSLLIGVYLSVGSASTAPTAGAANTLSHEVYIPPNTGRCIKTHGASALYLRSASSMTSGTAHIDVE